MNNQSLLSGELTSSRIICKIIVSSFAVGCNAQKSHISAQKSHFCIFWHISQKNGALLCKNDEQQFFKKAKSELYAEICDFCAL
jgi:hypothetical protein